MQAMLDNAEKNVQKYCDQIPSLVSESVGEEKLRLRNVVGQFEK
jgi:hypothetical protein